VKISFGDNDLLAALVAHALRADLLVLLSVVDGILDADGKPVRLIERLDAAKQLVRSEKSTLGKGGFNSSWKLPGKLTEFGEAMIVATAGWKTSCLACSMVRSLGRCLPPLVENFPPAADGSASARPAGAIVVDEGGQGAGGTKQKPAAGGVVRVEGAFQRGDVVAIHTLDGTVVARGLSNYDAESIARIRGKRTAEVKTLLAEASV